MIPNEEIKKEELPQTNPVTIEEKASEVT